MFLSEKSCEIKGARIKRVYKNIVYKQKLVLKKQIDSTKPICFFDIINL